MGCMGSKNAGSWQNESSGNNYISNRVKPLWIVKAGGTSISHWDILLMDDVPNTEDTVLFGLIADPLKDTGNNILSKTTAVPSMTSNTGILRAEVDLKHKENRSRKWYDDHNINYFRIPGAVSTESRLEKACRTVVLNFPYKLATQNCQTFVIEVLKVLHQWDAGMISPSAVKFCRTKCVPTVTYATRDNCPGVLSSKHPQRPQFTSDWSPAVSKNLVYEAETPVNISRVSLPSSPSRSSMQVSSSNSSMRAGASRSSLSFNASRASLPAAQRKPLPTAASTASLPTKKTANPPRMAPKSASESEVPLKTKMPGAWEW